MAKDITYLGVDIGTSGLKLVELKSLGGRANLLTYGFSEHDVNGVRDILENPQEAGKELAKLCKEAGVVSKKAITGLPLSSVFTTLFTFPDMPEKELIEQIENKTKTLSPIPEEDMVIDWKKVAPGDNKKELRISVTAASKKMIQSYAELFKSAGLQLSSLETEGYALVRALLGKDKALSILIDIGSAKTSLLVVKDGITLIHRTIKTGGDNISKMISQKMGIDEGTAEDVKKNFGESKIEGVKDVLKDVSDSIINEVKYCNELYKEQYNDGKTEKIVLTGGTALIGGVVDILQEASGLRVFIGDPWARIIYPDDLRPVLDSVGPKFSVAIGLALRDIL